MDNLLKREKLAAGAHFNIVSDPRFKFNRITFGFFVPLDEEKASLYALLPRYLYRANAEFPKGKDFNNYLASLYNARNDFEVASIGDTQFLGVSMNFMDDSYALHGEKITEAAAKALFSCVFNPLFAGGEYDGSLFELSKREQIEAIEAEINDKRIYAANQAKRIICKGEPAAVNPLGTAQRIREIAHVTLHEAYKELLESAVVEIVCVGCNDFSDAFKIAKEKFSTLERKEIVPCKSAYSPLKTAAAGKTEQLPLLNQSKMVLGFKTENRNRAALTLTSNLYGGTLSSKLFLNVRERLSLCYYCWSQVNKEKGVMSVSCGVEETNIEKAKAEILAQLDSVKQGNFTDDDLSNALLYEQNNIKTVNDSLGSMTWWYLTRIYISDIKSPGEALAAFDTITRDDIIEAANSMKLDTFYVLSPEESEHEPESEGAE
ncbi:MAG: insulinase family protein [Oscillospiraceae bacterium]|jgi:predicted Zn-dependent peptidase|nr:insulinase family protein [Oscillospiraceae bacterium]